MSIIIREYQPFTTTIPSGQALSPAIDMRAYAGGNFTTVSGLATNTKIGFKVSPTSAGTFIPLKASDGTLKEVTVSLVEADSYPLPDELFGVGFFKIWTEASGSNVNQVGDKTFIVTLKG